MKFVFGLLMSLLLLSCKETANERAARLVNEWNEKTISFPSNLQFSVLGKDSLDYMIPKKAYTILILIRWDV